MRRLFLIGLSLFLYSLVSAQTWDIGAPPTAAAVKATLSNDTLYIRGTGDIAGSTYLRIGSSSLPLIKNIIIEEGVTGTGSWAFSNYSNLVSITFPSTVKNIGDRVFTNCNALTSVIIAEGLENIGEYAFEYGNIASIIIPESVTKIGRAAFRDCNNLTSITIPSNVTNIESFIFFRCENLSSVTIPNSVNNIGESAFSGCSSLSSITLPSGLKSIEREVFNGCSSLSSIIIPDSVTSIGFAAFVRSGLSSITIPASVTSIEAMAFSNCTNLSSVNISNGVIGSSAFEDCSNLSSVIISKGVTSIGTAAFKNCSNLSSVIIFKGVTEIQSSAFADCSNLSSITIPESVTEIQSRAFAGCNSLTSFRILNPVPPGNYANKFTDVDLSSATLTIPCGSLPAYQRFSTWSRLSSGGFGIIEEDCPPIPGISNVRSSFSCPGKMAINYDLGMDNGEKPTNVTVSYSTDNGRTYHPCTTVTGDLKNQSTGSNKSVTWDLKADGFKTGFFVFKVEAENTNLECVMINGVCWATRNVDAPGTFAASPEDPGMFYQWNRTKGWAATGIVTGWDSSTPTGTTWETANNVCPTGYRVPTDAEIRSLIDAGSQWIIQNGVNGRVFGSGDNTLFLPAAGYRYDSGGTLYVAGSDGSYWSSTQNNTTDAYNLLFGSSGAGRGYNYRNNGFSVRCVAD